MNINFTQYRWKNRLLIVMANREDNPKFVQIQRDFQRARSEIVERKLVKKTFIRPKLQPEFQILLYTLDGQFKRRLVDYPGIEGILKLIDQMPIRKAEIKKNRTQLIVRT